MDAFIHYNFTKTLDMIFIFPVVVLQLIHLFEVKGDGAFAAIDFETIAISSAACKTGGFERTDSTIFKPGKEQGGVIHGDLPHLT